METAYEVLPATRAWPLEIERLAQALIEGGGVFSTRGELAGLSLLLRGDERPILGREEMAPYIWRDHGKPVAVRWALLAAETRGSRVRLARFQCALISIACSLATDTSVVLGDALKALPEPYADAVIDAIAYACGVTR
jgi:hypothetical protein